MTSIWWIRRDVRLHDQPALQAALQRGRVLPVFILDPVLLEHTPRRRQAFLFEGLRELGASLGRRGARLVVRKGAPEAVLRALMDQAQAEAIFAEEDFTPYARRRDTRVRDLLNLKLVRGQTVHHPTEVHKADGTPYIVYSPYARAWKRALPERLSPIPAPETIESPKGIESDEIPEIAFEGELRPGEEAARQRLQAFARSGIRRYQTDRDMMGRDGTSRLSTYLHFGMISVREAASEALAAMAEALDEEGRTAAEVWLNELIWREFYIQILYHFPWVANGSFRREFDAIDWRNDLDEFHAWKTGSTGVPVVDAAMRQLEATGWMHNRSRMIAASYLVKDLLIDWRWGEKWFMEQLIDGDVAANNGGWQWTAGTGTDAAPYFRIFNPVLQSRKFDSDGMYIRQWVPELREVPASTIHSPWAKGIEVPGYPKKPLVNHVEAIRRARLAYENAKDAAATAGSKTPPRYGGTNA
jgi:deoxyribodipyrimidine photo-lyase